MYRIYDIINLICLEYCGEIIGMQRAGVLAIICFVVDTNKFGIFWSKGWLWEGPFFKKICPASSKCTCLGY
jgi:hypothetical protein